MFNLLRSTGCFSIPLVMFLFITIFVSIDRWLALRNTVLGMNALKKFLLDGQFEKSVHQDLPTTHTLFERILSFYQKISPNPEEIRAYTEFELSKLERGLFLLNIVISAAPLVGLLGTVSGLMRVFSGFMSGTEMSNEVLANGIALALSTTALGLMIAVPSIIVNDTINRRLDKIHTAVNILTERLIGLDGADEK